MRGKIIVFIILIVSIMSMNLAWAKTKTYDVTVSVKTSSGKTLENGKTYVYDRDISSSDKIVVNASAKDEMSLSFSSDEEYMNSHNYKVNTKGMALLAYMWDSTNPSNATMSKDPTKVTISLPTIAKGSTHVLRIAGAGAADNNTDPDTGDYYVVKTDGWVTITIVSPAEEEETVFS